MSCCDTLEEKNIQLRYDCGELRSHVLDLEIEVKRLREQYNEIKDALVGDSPNWTHEELIVKTLELIDNDTTLMRFDIEHAIDHSWASWEDLKMFLKEMIE